MSNNFTKIKNSFYEIINSCISRNLDKINIDWSEEKVYALCYVPKVIQKIIIISILQI